MASDCIDFEVKIDNDDGTSLPLEAMHVSAVTNEQSLADLTGRADGVGEAGSLEAAYPINPLVDRNLMLSAISICSEGLRSVRPSLMMPLETSVTSQRKTSGPTVAQVDVSTHTNIRLAIDNYSTLAIKRRVRLADDEDMTTNVHMLISEVYPGDVLPRLLDLARDDTGSGTRSIWVRISHSSGGDYTDESIAQEFVYADNFWSWPGLRTSE